MQHKESRRSLLLADFGYVFQYLTPSPLLLTPHIVFWLASLGLLIRDWRSGKASGPRDVPFAPPEAHEEGYAYGHEEQLEEEEDTSYSSIPPVSQRQTTYEDAGSPFADPSGGRYRDSDSTAYSGAPTLPQISAGRPSMDAYGAFDDPAPSGFGAGSPGGYGQAAPQSAYVAPAPAPNYAAPPPAPSTPPAPAVSRTMQYADPYAAVRATIGQPQAPATPPTYDAYNTGGFR